MPHCGNIRDHSPDFCDHIIIFLDKIAQTFRIPTIVAGDS
jgi:hypothetical protein